MYIYLAKGAVLQSLMVMGTYTACTWNHMYSSPGINWATVLYCTVLLEISVMPLPADLCLVGTLNLLSISHPNP